MHEPVWNENIHEYFLRNENVVRYYEKKDLSHTWNQLEIKNRNENIHAKS